MEGAALRRAEWSGNAPPGAPGPMACEHRHSFFAEEKRWSPSRSTSSWPQSRPVHCINKPGMEILPICLRSNTGPSNIAIAAIFVGTLTGCVVGPDYKTPDLAVPTHWGSKATSKPSQTPQLSQWWKQLKDPTLDALIAEAIASNLDVATAKAKIREARATYREQRGALLPTASATASAARTRTSAAEGGTTDATFSTLYDGGSTPAGSSISSAATSAPRKRRNTASMLRMSSCATPC